MGEDDLASQERVGPLARDALEALDERVVDEGDAELGGGSGGEVGEWRECWREEVREEEEVERRGKRRSINRLFLLKIPHVAAQLVVVDAVLARRDVPRVNLLLL